MSHPARPNPSHPAQGPKRAAQDRSLGSSDALRDPSVVDVEDVVRSLRTDLERGLSTQEAARRLATDGPNELRAVPPIPVWRRALAQLQNTQVYLLLTAAAVALLVWVLEGRHGWPLDVLVIVGVILVNATLGYLQETKAASAVAALARLTRVTSTVLRDGEFRRIQSAELVEGDLLSLNEGDAVGADARLVHAASLRVLEASLTGESEAVLKDAARLAAPAPLGDRLDMVFKGTAVVQGTGSAVVTATGPRSEMGKIAALLAATPEAATPLQREIARIGRTLGIAAVGMAFIVVATILVTSDVASTTDVVKVLLLGVSLAVAAVPEGLLAILSVVLAMGVRRMAHRNAIVKQLASIETLGSASVIATDKTGTLTRGEMTIVRLTTPSGSSEVTGVGYAPVGEVQQADAALRDEHHALLCAGCLASDAHLRQGTDGEWEIEGDPTEAAFLVAERKLGPDDVALRRKARFRRFGELPFTSQRKLMSTLVVDHDRGERHLLLTKGAPEVLLERCTHARIGGETVGLDAALRARLSSDVAALTERALRALAVACRTLEPGTSAPPLGFEHTLEAGLEYLGAVGMLDPPREEARAAIEAAHRAGVRVVMITGDHPRTALRIASDLGIVPRGAATEGAESAGPVLDGVALDALDDTAFAARVEDVLVFARVSPTHKLRIVRALQTAGNVVAMTGDGVNDAPALKAADIGVAMGQAGTEVAKEAAKMVLADDNFATIVAAVREGRGILDNIQKFLRYLLSSNFGEVLTVFLGVLCARWIGLDEAGAAAGDAVVLPLLATQILWINLVTDTGPALAMGVDPTSEDVMRRRPRAHDEPVIDARIWRSVAEVGIVMAALTLVTFDLYLPGGLIEGEADLTLARTAAFTVLVLAQLFNAFNARSGDVSAFFDLWSNHWLWGACSLSAALQVAVVHTPLLNEAFGTTPMSAQDWGVCIALASGVLWVSELSKLVRRRWPNLWSAETSAPENESQRTI
jgi:Ca2+-transporting ATPase